MLVEGWLQRLERDPRAECLDRSRPRRRRRTGGAADSRFVGDPQREAGDAFTLLAHADATWIAIDPASIRPVTDTVVTDTMRSTP